jgi:hypothetical protein
MTKGFPGDCEGRVLCPARLSCGPGSWAYWTQGMFDCHFFHPIGEGGSLVVSARWLGAQHPTLDR